MIGREEGVEVSFKGKLPQQEGLCVSFGVQPEGGVAVMGRWGIYVLPDRMGGQKFWRPGKYSKKIVYGFSNSILAVGETIRLQKSRHTARGEKIDI